MDKFGNVISKKEVVHARLADCILKTFMMMFCLSPQMMGEGGDQPSYLAGDFNRCVCVPVLILLITSTQENTGGIQVAHATHLHPREHKSPCLKCNNNIRNYIYKNMPLRNGTHYIDILFQVSNGQSVFQYSAMYRTARTSGFEPIMHDGDHLTEIFRQLDSMVPDEENTGTEFVGFSEERSMTFDERMLSLHLLNASIHLHGFYQSWKYCHLYKHELQRQFTFSQDTQHKSAVFLESIRSMFSNPSTMGPSFVVFT